MAELNLRAYIDYISDRLTRGAYAEVVAQCRHVLETYPKYVECYKLLGRALLGREQYRDAVDVFQRVLSCDPNDYTSHVGISNAFQQLREVDAAIWHLERAYEQVPGNTRLEDELRNLFQVKTGSAPRQIRRTSGALARLYAKGGLYQQAIPELRKALRNTPERLDLQVLLGLVLWDAREPMEAGQVAAKVFRQLPNSIDANRILANLWLMAEQPDEAQPFIERLNALDPYLGFEIENRRKAPVDRFRVVRLERTSIAGLEADEELPEHTDWLDALDTVDKKEGVTGPLSSGSVTDVFTDEDAPDWLKEAQTQDDRPTGTGRLSEPRSLEQIMAEENQTGGLTAGPMLSGDEPDWLRDTLTEETPAGLRAADDETPDWLRDVLGQPEEEAAEEAPTDEAEPIVEEQQVTPLEPEVGPEGYDTQEMMAAMGFEDGEGNIVEPELDTDIMPDWLLESTDAEEAAAQPAVTMEDSPPAQMDDKADANVPEWLRDVAEAPAAAPPEGLVAAEPPASPGDDDVPSWLSDLVDDEESGPVTADVGLPDWFSDIADEEDDDLAAILANAPAGSGETDEDTEVPAWLAGLVDEEGDEPTSVVQDKDEWLASLLVESDDEKTAELPPITSPEVDEEDEVPAWLGSPSAPAAEVQPSEPVEEDGLPDWLKASTSMPEGTRSPVQESEPADDELPEWLRDSTPSPVSSSEGAPVMQEAEQDGDELPAWLQGSTTPSKPQPQEEKTPPPADELPEWLAASGSPILESDQPAEQERSAPEEVSQMVPPDDDSMFDDGDMPDWLTEGNLDDSDAAMAWLNEIAAKYDPDFQAEGTEEPSEQATPEPVAETSASDNDLPDWLSDSDDATAADDMPDWLTEEPAETPTSAASMIEDDDLPDWLKDEPAAAESPETEPMLKFSADDDDLPDWLTEGPSEDDIAELEGSLDFEDEDLPDWLKDEDEPEPVRSEAQPETVSDDVDDDMPDWLKDVPEEQASTPIAETEAPAPSAPTETPEEEADETPAWLTEGNLDDEEAAMAWLNEIAAKYDPDFESEGEKPAEPEPVAQEPATTEEADDEMPDWLKDVPEEEPTPEPAKAEEADALAWLDEQAAEQGVSEGELVSEALTEDKPPTPEMPFIPDPDAKATEASEDEMPDWLKDVDATTLEEAQEEELVFELEDEEDDLESALDDIFGEAPTEEDELDAIFAAEAVTKTEAKAEDEEGEEESTGLTGWLKSAEAAEKEAAAEADELPTWMGPATEQDEEDDLAAFLRATEPAKTAPLTQPQEAPEAPAASAQPPQTSELEPPQREPEEKPAPVAEPTPLARPPRTTSMLPELRRRPLPEGQAGELVRRARAQIEDAQFDEALATYEMLIVNQQSLDVVVGDLQNLLDARPNPRTRRVLGDALMMQGSLDDALTMYRTALEEL